MNAINFRRICICCLFDFAGKLIYLFFPLNIFIFPYVSLF
uniref:Uncharacterized protein n=1 Tax=Populus trichocarpa TaxID=3694 RepID=A9P9E5_POPTR|nr:unknown [Populus trichocarpa]